jgi:tryptophan-associated transmembrane protein
VRTQGDMRPPRELAAVLLAGAVGAGLVLLITRQHVASVIVRAPRPLPATVTAVSVTALRPAIGALAIAVFASLAAVLATRGLLRRLTGLITCVLGAGIGVLAVGKVTHAAVVTAAGRAAAGPAAGAGAGTAAGSATAGSWQGTAAGSLSGLGSRVLFSGSAWQMLIVAGAVLIVAAGIAIVILATRLPAMSGRYERPRATAGPAAEASVWDALSAGVDPTVGPP